MLRASLVFIAVTLLGGCTSTPGSPTEQTIIEKTPTEDISIEEPTTPPEPTIKPSPTTEPKVGELLWSFKPGAALETPFWVSPLTSATEFNGIVYVGASNAAGGNKGSLQALDATDGSLIWSYDHNGHTTINAHIRRR